MSLRKTPYPKRNPDRHETDYERWLKDHEDRYQPAGKPRYHPSDVDDTNEREGDEREQNILRLQEYSKTSANTKTNAPFTHADENADIDDDERVVQVSRHGSIMFSSTRSGETGHRSSIEAGASMLRSSHGEPARFRVLSILFLTVLLLGIGLSMRKYRLRQRGISTREGRKYEKVRSIGMFPRSTVKWQGVC